MHFSPSLALVAAAAFVLGVRAAGETPPGNDASALNAPPGATGSTTKQTVDEYVKANDIQDLLKRACTEPCSQQTREPADDCAKPCIIAHAKAWGLAPPNF